MTCYLIGIISGVLLNERVSCRNKWTDTMSAIFLIRGWYKWQPTVYILIFGVCKCRAE